MTCQPRVRIGLGGDRPTYPVTARACSVRSTGQLLELDAKDGGFACLIGWVTAAQPDRAHEIASLWKKWAKRMHVIVWPWPRSRWGKARLPPRSIDRSERAEIRRQCVTVTLSCEERQVRNCYAPAEV